MKECNNKCKECADKHNFPYKYCCLPECGNHEFCIGCNNYDSNIKGERYSMNKERAKNIIEEMFNHWKQNRMTFQETLALEKAKDALEKQIEKQAISVHGNVYYKCPSCGEFELEPNCEDYCPRCGQKLKY